MRADRIVKRNIKRAIARGTNYMTNMKQQVFYQGIKFGVDMEKARLLNSTAHLTYTEEITNAEAPIDNLAGHDDAPNVPPTSSEEA